MRHIALQGRQHVRVPRGVVRLSAHVGNGTTPVLQALQGGRRLPDDRPHPTMLVLRDVTERTLVRVLPPRAAAFAERTVVRLTLRIDTPNAQYEITVQPVDVSSLPLRDLVSVEPDGDDLRVTARDAVSDLPVGPLAVRARGEARRRLGYDRVRDDRAVRVAIGIDVSASMAHPLRDGGVHAAVDVLAGLWQVVGDEDEFPLVCLLGEETTWLPAVAPAEMAAALTDHVEGNGFELGSRAFLPDPPGPRVVRRTARFVVTDGIPADFTRLPPGEVALIVVGGGVSAQAAGRGVTVLPPPAPGQTPPSRLLDVPGALAAVVEPLLHHCGVEDR